jgi:hypothetical protein
MDLKRLTDRARELVDKRGGTDALKEDADELKRIAQGEGSITDKAKDAAAALKEPGGDETAEAAKPAAPTAGSTPAGAARAEQKTEGEARGKHADKGRGRGQGKRRGGGGRGGGRGRNRL